MTDYQRMPDADSENQVKTALNDSNDEDASQSKIQEKALAQVKKNESQVVFTQSVKMEKKLNDKELALTEIFQNFKKQKLILNETGKKLEYKDYCIAYNNSLICIDNDSNQLSMYSTNDETVEKENEKENYGVWYGDSLDEDEEKRQKYGVYRQKETYLKKDFEQLMEEVKEHRERENQAEGGEEAQEEQQPAEAQEEQEKKLLKFTFVESFPDLYKVVLGTSNGDLIVLSAIDFSYENSYSTQKGEVIDLVASKKDIFSMHEGGVVCKLNISSKKINDFKELEIGKQGEILAMKISPNKRWLAYTQEIRKLPEKEEKKEHISWDLVIKDLDKSKEKSEDSEDSNQDDNDDQVSQNSGLYELNKDDNKKPDEIRYPIKIYPVDTEARDRKGEFGEDFWRCLQERDGPVLQQLKGLFEFTPDSKNIVTRTDLRVVKSFSVDKVETNAVVEKLCGDKSRVLKFQILADNQTLICMSGGDKDLKEDIKIINLESTKKQINLGCTNPLDFCCSSDSKMIFVVDADPALQKSCIRGFDLKSQIQLINHVNIEMNFCTIDISPDCNYLYVNEYRKLGSLSYFKLADYQMAIEEKDIIMDDEGEFLMQYNKKTGFAELWDLKSNLIKSIYRNCFPKIAKGEYFYYLELLEWDRQYRGRDQYLKKINFKTLDQEQCSHRLYTFRVIESVQISEDEKYFFFVNDGNLNIYDILKQELSDERWQYGSKYPENYVALQLSHDETFIMLATDDRVRKFNIKDGKFLEGNYEQSGSENNWYLKTMDAFSPDDSYLLARQFQTDRIEKYNLNSFETTKVIKEHKKDRVLQCCFVENAKNLVTMNANQLIYWEINGDDFIKLEQVDKTITPIYGYNNKMTGLRVDGKLYPWSKHLIYQLSGNFLELNKFKQEYEEKGQSDPKCCTYLNNLNLSQGPYNRLFPLIFKYFETFEDEEDQDKTSMIEHMLDNVISSHGFTFLGYLTQTNKQAFIKEALKYEPTFFRDSNGNLPLTIALKKQSVTTVNMLVDFVANDQRLVEQLNHEEVCALLEFSPSNLPKLIDNSISKIRGAPPLGIDINEDLTDFCSIENIDPDKLHDLLCNTEAKEEEKKLVVYKNISFKLNLIPGSEESVRFHECLAQCTESDVFSSDAIKYILEYKWQLLQQKTLPPLFVSSGFVVTLLVHVYTPGQLIPLQILLLFAVFLLLIEIFKFIAGGIRYVNKPNILLIILVPIYVFQTMSYPTRNTDYILPACNLLSWFNFTTQLRSFTSIRAFMVVLVESVVSIQAFFAFFLLMLCTFTFTLLLQKKIKTRWTVFDQKIQEAQDQGIEFDMNYSTKLYESKVMIDGEEMKLTEEVSDILPGITKMFYDTYLKMLGEFGDIMPPDYNYFEMGVFVILTFILCITLLNLVIALMSSAYEEFKEQKVSKEQRELNKIILETEVKMMSQRKRSVYTYLIWMEYQEDNMEKKSETTQINEMMGETQVQLQKIISDAKNQDDKIDKIASAQSLLQKEVGQVQKEVGQINTSLTELIKLIKKDQAQE